jgi:hypothetical protein
MATDSMALLELIEKRADGDLVRELLADAAERLPRPAAAGRACGHGSGARRSMAVEGLCGAGHGERSPARTNQRDGYRERLLAGFNGAYNAHHQRVLNGRSPEEVVRDRLAQDQRLANLGYQPPPILVFYPVRCWWSKPPRRSHNQTARAAAAAGLPIAAPTGGPTGAWHTGRASRAPDRRS